MIIIYGILINSVVVLRLLFLFIWFFAVVFGDLGLDVQFCGCLNCWLYCLVFPCGFAFVVWVDWWLLG